METPNMLLLIWAVLERSLSPKIFVQSCYLEIFVETIAEKSFCISKGLAVFDVDLIMSENFSFLHCSGYGVRRWGYATNSVREQ